MDADRTGSGVRKLNVEWNAKAASAFRRQIRPSTAYADVRVLGFDRRNDVLARRCGQKYCS